MKTFLVSYLINGHFGHVHIDTDQWGDSSDTLLVMGMIAGKVNVQTNDVVITSVFELVK